MSAEASKQDRAANVQLLPVAVCRWPFLFMITSEDVTPGGCVTCSLYPWVSMHIQSQVCMRRASQMGLHRMGVLSTISMH